MWKPPVNYLTLHYTYIITCSLLGFILIVGAGNVPTIDAFFFGVSGSTESGLNTIDVKEIRLYQQIVIYILPCITNMAFINIIVVVVRLYWFEKHFKANPQLLPVRAYRGGSIPAQPDVEIDAVKRPARNDEDNDQRVQDLQRQTTIRFQDKPTRPNVDKALYIPPPHLRDRGHPLLEVERQSTLSSLTKKESRTALDASGVPMSDRKRGRSMEQIASSAFSIGPKRPARGRKGTSRTRNLPRGMPKLSEQVTIGRNSHFHNMSTEDREILGGVEYVALKLLLKLILGYFFGLHLLGLICLLPWIHNAPAEYQDWIAETGVSKTWWAFYSAQTMVNNLGFTLTPDSMVSFRAATWPMLIMTFLAFAGNTCYPIFLRFSIWFFFNIVPKNSKLRQPLNFLLEHPRRCYTLLFPSKPTWILFGILIALNTLDVILIITLDLDNDEVTAGLSMGPRVLAALFQAASSRHTGTSTFNLAEVSPAVQVSLLVMMYIAVFPIAMSIRSSNTYEERSLGIYANVDGQDLDEQNTRSYLLTHMQNQLSFDLWYIFSGIFCICVAEAGRLSDNNDPGFNVFAIFFEVVSAYGNVGLSLGHPNVSTSLTGQFTVFSKAVICAMMIRGRHRMLPYSLDRAIVLPDERLALGESVSTEKQEDELVYTKPALGVYMDRDKDERVDDGLKLKRHMTH